MSVKKKKSENIQPEKIAKKEKYSYGVGRRKTAVATAKVFDSGSSAEGLISVNGKKMAAYFPASAYQNTVLAPLKMAGLSGKMEIISKVKGGGIKGQAEALRLAISRALVEYDSGLKKTLKSAGYLTRDARMVERKKPGLKKARRAPQWAKR